MESLTVTSNEADPYNGIIFQEEALFSVSPSILYSAVESRDPLFQQLRHMFCEVLQILPQNLSTGGLNPTLFGPLEESTIQR